MDASIIIGAFMGLEVLLACVLVSVPVVCLSVYNRITLG